MAVDPQFYAALQRKRVIVKWKKDDFVEAASRSAALDSHELVSLLRAIMCCEHNISLKKRQKGKQNQAGFLPDAEQLPRI